MCRLFVLPLPQVSSHSTSRPIPSTIARLTPRAPSGGAAYHSAGTWRSMLRSMGTSEGHVRPTSPCVLIAWSHDDSTLPALSSYDRFYIDAYIVLTQYTIYLMSKVYATFFFFFFYLNNFTYIKNVFFQLRVALFFQHRLGKSKIHIDLYGYNKSSLSVELGL